MSEQKNVCLTTFDVAFINDDCNLESMCRSLTWNKKLTFETCRIYSKDISDLNNNAWLLAFSSIEEKNMISGLRQITDNVRPDNTFKYRNSY